MQWGRAPAWDKIVLIQMQLAAGYDLVIWLDADTVVVRPEIDLRTALSEGAPIGMCKHPLPWGAQPWHWNSGVIFVRNTKAARWFFDEAWRTDRLAHPWHEQARINELAEQHPHLIQEIGAEWNCTRGMTFARHPIVCAWHGRGLGALASIKAAVRRRAKERNRA
jgi:hypothetical protein